MKNKLLILAIILASATQVFAEKSCTIPVTVTIPVIPGYNAPADQNQTSQPNGPIESGEIVVVEEIGTTQTVYSR
jgi:hypothetical protein